MPLSPPPVPMKFTGYQVLPAPVYPPVSGETGISVLLFFFCENPGPNMPGNYEITLTSTDIQTINSAGTDQQKQTALRNMAIAKLQAQLRPAVAIGAFLDQFINSSINV